MIKKRNEGNGSVVPRGWGEQVCSGFSMQYPFKLAVQWLHRPCLKGPTRSIRRWMPAHLGCQHRCCSKGIKITLCCFLTRLPRQTSPTVSTSASPFASVHMDRCCLHLAFPVREDEGAVCSSSGLSLVKLTSSAGLNRYWKAHPVAKD